MRLVAGDGGDPQRILLEPFGKRDDRLREGGRKQQRAPFRRGGVENLFQIVPKPKVQHLVGLVQDDGAQMGGNKASTLEMVALTARCPDADMRALAKGALFPPPVHLAATWTAPHPALCLHTPNLSIPPQR